MNPVAALQLARVAPRPRRVAAEAAPQGVLFNYPVQVNRAVTEYKPERCEDGEVAELVRAP
jgi:hypothetical protein